MPEARRLTLTAAAVGLVASLLAILPVVCHSQGQGAPLKITLGDGTATATIGSGPWDPQRAKVVFYRSIYTSAHYPFTLDCFKPLGNDLYLTGLGRKTDLNGDGVWNYTCGRNTAKEAHCTWTDSYTDAQSDFAFKCPSNQFLMGIAGTRPTDGARGYKFKCCEDKDLIMKPCKFTTFANEFDYLVNHDELIQGVQNYRAKDNSRKFRFRVCKYAYA